MTKYSLSSNISGTTLKEIRQKSHKNQDKENLKKGWPSQKVEEPHGREQMPASTKTLVLIHEC